MSGVRQALFPPLSPHPPPNPPFPSAFAIVIARRAPASGGDNLHSDGLVPTEGSANLTEFYNESLELVMDVLGQTKCRRCSAGVPIGKWSYVRLESVISPLLRPGEAAEVGIQSVVIVEQST